MTAPAPEPRFVVKEHQGRPGATGAPVTIYRIFDNHKQAYPRLVAGLLVQDHYSARDYAQGVANSLNENTP